MKKILDSIVALVMVSNLYSYEDTQWGATKNLQGEISLSELVGKFENGDYDIQDAFWVTVGDYSDEKKATTLKVDTDNFFDTFYMSFVGPVTLEYSSLQSVRSDVTSVTAGFYDISQGNSNEDGESVSTTLTISIGATAADQLFATSYGENSNIFKLYDGRFSLVGDSTISLLFNDVAKEGTVIRASDGAEFKNVGLIRSTEQLNAGEIGILVAAAPEEGYNGFLSGQIYLAAAGVGFIRPTVETPEPTTGALSLLALAGLAARRRRK